MYKIKITHIVIVVHNHTFALIRCNFDEEVRGWGKEEKGFPVLCIEHGFKKLKIRAI